MHLLLVQLLHLVIGVSFGWGSGGLVPGPIDRTPPPTLPPTQTKQEPRALPRMPWGAIVVVSTHLLELHAVVLEDDGELGVEVRLERLALEDRLCDVVFVCDERDNTWKVEWLGTVVDAHSYAYMYYCIVCMSCSGLSCLEAPEELEGVLDGGDVLEALVWFVVLFTTLVCICS